MDEVLTSVYVNNKQEVNEEIGNKISQLDIISGSKRGEIINNQNNNSSRSINSDNYQDDLIIIEPPQILSEKHTEINNMNTNKKLSKDAPSRQSLTQLTPITDHLSTDSDLTEISIEKHKDSNTLIDSHVEVSNMNDEQIMDDSGFILEKPTIQPSPKMPFSPPIPDIHATDDHIKAISPEITNSTATFVEEPQKVESKENAKKVRIQYVEPQRNKLKNEKSTTNKIIGKRLGPKRISLNPQRHPNIEKQSMPPKEDENSIINELKNQKSKLNQEIIELEIDHSKIISEMSPSQFDSILLSSRNHFLSNLNRATISYNERLSRMNLILFSLNEELSRFSSSKSSMTSSFTSSEIKRDNIELKRSIEFVRKEIEMSNDASEIIVTSKDSVVSRDRDDLRSEKQMIRNEIALIRQEIESKRTQSEITAQSYLKAIESIKSMEMRFEDEIEENFEPKKPISRALFDNAEKILEKRRRAQSEYYEAKKESGSPQKEEKLQSSLNEYRATIALLPNLSVSELYDNLSTCGTKLTSLNEALKKSVESSIMLHSDLIDQQVEEIESRCHSEILASNVDLSQSSKEIIKKIQNEIVKNEFNRGELKTIFRWAQTVKNNEVSDRIHQILLLVKSLK